MPGASGDRHQRRRNADRMEAGREVPPMDDERKGSLWIAWGSAIVVLMGLYVGAYVLTADAQLVVSQGSRASGFLVHVEPRYRFAPQWFAETAFSPIHRIDRNLRRQKWEWTPPPTPPKPNPGIMPEFATN